MTEECEAVFLVDDDAAVLKALTRLLTAAGFRVRAFLSASQFLEQHDPECPGCVVADLAMPDMSGMALQEALQRSGRDRPIVFVTGRGDIATGVRAMKQGAVDFLTKPVHGRELIAAVGSALERDRLIRREWSAHKSIEARLVSLTPREREVLAGVVSGRLNKQIAAELGTAEKTVKVHRARVMAKMGVRSLADLVRVAQRAGITGK